MEIFTVIFMITGMSHTRSIFQVISLLTNSGFTTQESEIVISSRKRRKIAITTMIFGNIFNVAIVSLLVNVIMSFSEKQQVNLMPVFIYLISFFTLIILIKKIPFIRVGFDKLIKRAVGKVMFSKNSNPLLILDNFSGFVIVEVKVLEVPNILKDKTLDQANITKGYGIKILTIKRGDITIGDVTKDEVIIKNDRLIIFGSLIKIIELFNQQPSMY